MTGRTPRQALDSFLGPFQRAVSCITNAVFQCKLSAKPGLHGVAALLPQTKLKAAKETFYVGVTLYFRIIEETGALRPYRVTTTAYYYDLLDSEGKEIIAYHWHPEGISPIRFPHLHLSAGGGCQREELTTAHLPTGRIAVEDFLRLAIVDFKVEPLRADWRQVFSETQRDFEL